MRAWLCLLLSLSGLSVLSQSHSLPILRAVAAESEPLAAPVAARKPVRLAAHGIERTDDYAWLRDPNWRDVLQDPSRLSPDIRAYLEAENRYAEAVLAPMSALRVRLVAEMKGRIEQSDEGVPTPAGPYAYWQRYVPGAEHPHYLRAARAGGSEQILLDGPALAHGKAYFKIGDQRPSPDHRLYAYLADESGSEKFTLRVRDVTSGQDLPDVLANVSSMAWAADSRTLFYVRLDSDLRRRHVYRHALGTDATADVLVYEEKDLTFEVLVDQMRTGRFVAIITGTPDTNETWLIEAGQPEAKPKLVAPREPGLRYDVEDGLDRLVIVTNADGAEDFKLVTAPVATPDRSHWRDLVPYRQGRQILKFLPFSAHLAWLERENGLPRIVIRNNADGAEHALAFAEEAYTLEFATTYEFDTRTLRFTYSSPAVPQQTIDYDMGTRERVVRKQQRIPTGHDPSAYAVRRLFVRTSDNELVPITVLHRKELRLDASAPLFLEGYGAYAYVFDARFDSNVFSLIDRGFVYAIAHVRGGLEKGERWRNGGRGPTKMNTFTDFIAAAEYLANERYTSRGRIVARGDSAGGLLMGAVTNMRPDLFAGVIARVPFVDALNTMLDDTLPLTTTDFPEWGNPIESIAAYRVIASYAPYENVKAQLYPHMLVTAGISDPRVTYWEPAKWVAKLRAMKTNDSRIALVTRMSAGHFGAAGRFEWLDEVALIGAFALDIIGLNDAPPPAGRAAPPLSKVLQAAPPDPLGAAEPKTFGNFTPRR